jgi:hypothetical protein
MAPIIGSVSIWMNPHSGWLSKGIAVAAVLPMVSEIAGLGNLTRFGSLSAEVDSAAGEIVAESVLGETEQALQTLAPELEGNLPSTAEQAAAANLRHVLAGGSADRGIGVLHLDVSELTPAEVSSTVDAIRDIDFQAGMAGGLTRTAVPSRSVADSVAALARSRRAGLNLGPTEVAGHLPDVAGGGSPLGPIVGMPRSVNSSIGGQWSRYAPGFKFDGFSLIDRETGQFLYTSHALENPPTPILDFRF